jgi:hypothetical protein
MSLASAITFAVAVNDSHLLERTLLTSPCLQEPHPHQILVQCNFRSAAQAYNDAIDRSRNDLIVFCHQDVYLPATWIPQLQQALGYLAAQDPNWGVVGPYGKTADGGGWGYVYSTGRGIIGEPPEPPVPVQTLDEIVLVLRKSSGLRFDDALPHFHLYGADICLRAKQRGMQSYAVSAFCVHNTQMNLVLPREFYESYKRLKQVWKKHLPVQTTCIRISRSGLPMYARRLQEFRLRHFKRQTVAAHRLLDIRPLVQALEATSPRK